MSTTTARPASRWATAVAGAKVIGGIYRDRALTAYAARVQKDLAARLGLAEYQADPYPIYDQIRDQGPLAPTRLGNLISATHAVCSEIVRSRSFVVFRPEQAADDPLPREMLDLSLLEMDPPEHTRLRRLVAPAFTPRRMAKYETLVAQRIGELLDAVDPHAGFDLVSEFAAPLPIAVISALLGVPDVDEKAFAAYGATLATALDGISSVGHLRRLLQAQSQLRQIFADLFERRASDPRDDIVSALLAEQNEEVTPALLGPLCRLLLVAGFETTVNAIGNGVRALLANPDQWQMLVEDPDRAPAVVEEVLRYDPPVQVTARAARDATEVAGVPGPAVRPQCCCSRGPIGIRRRTRRRTASTSPAGPGLITSRSPAASTTAWAPRWRGSSWPQPFGHWPSAYPLCDSPEPWGCSARPLSTGLKACRWRPEAVGSAGAHFIPAGQFRKRTLKRALRRQSRRAEREPRAGRR
jgi:cytochrome P450